MKAIVCFVFLIEIFVNCEFDYVGLSASNKTTFLMVQKASDVFPRRFKRYLIFEKGATLTFQGNIAKSIIPPAPKGLNMITEYTLVYDLPADFRMFKKQHKKVTKETAGSHQPHYRQHMIVPFTYDYFYQIHPEYFDDYLIKRKHIYFKESPAARKCLRKKFYNYKEKFSNVCLKRIKRRNSRHLTELTPSQRILYDLVEKWSLMHGFVARYCFMRTLCESFGLLLPYGHSLLHDIIHILLSYTKPWAFQHKIFGRALRQRHSVEDCAKLYGLYCRVSWLDFITNTIYGSTVPDLMG